MRLWEEEVIARVGAWAERDGVCVYEVYSGGSTRVRRDKPEHDS